MYRIAADFPVGQTPAMDVIYSKIQQLHDPQTFISAGRVTNSPEQPERAERFLRAIDGLGYAIAEPAAYSDAKVAAVHSVDYLDFLQNGHARWSALPGAGPEIIPNVHPGRHMKRRSAHIIGQAGYHMADTACPIGADTWRAARAGADCALTATDRVLQGSRVAYALCRPPGHHAYADMAGGFCFLNNVAIAAEHALAAGRRPAIIDIDVHHGNGTQGIFDHRSDVYFTSVHGDPDDFYPWFAGFADDRGAGAGHGYTLNLPLPRGTGDDAWLAAIETGLDGIRTFGADVILVSLGLDASEKDPLQFLSVTTDGFRRAGHLIASAATDTVLVQEGGYLSDELGQNLAAFLGGFEAA